MDFANYSNRRRSVIVLSVCSIGAATGAFAGLGGYPRNVVMALLAIAGAFMALVIFLWFLDRRSTNQVKRDWKPTLVIVAFFALLVSWLIYTIYPFIRHSYARKKMDTAILKLATNRPRDLTDDQWAYCIAWTWNLHSNYGSNPSYVSTADLERIERELQLRIDRRPGLETIDWIWDQYMQSCPRASFYEGFRPTAAHNRAEFDVGAHGGSPLSWWRSEYRRRTAQLEQER